MFGEFGCLIDWASYDLYTGGARALSMLRVVGFALVVSTFAACQKSKPDSVAARDAAERQYVIGLSQCNLGEPWRVQMNADISKAIAAHSNLRLVAKDAQNDSLVQRAQVEELVAQGIDLLLISPKESAPLTKPVAEAYRKKIPVIVLDRAVEGDEFSTFIGADNARIGLEAGKFVVRALGGKGNVVELKGLMTSTPGQDRNSGFRKGLELEKNPGLKLVFEADMQWLEPKARTEMDAALAREQKIDLVYAHNDPGAHGAYLAAKAAGREKQMKFVGIDALPHEGVTYVKQGILDATFLYPTGGAEAVENALKILKGEAVPKKIVLGTRVFTRDNVERGGEEIR
jgi:ribose transport system substrate-binding protein